MHFGNEMFGADFNKDYSAIYLFPLGIEVLFMDGISISFIVMNVDFNFTIRENITLFRD